MNVVIVDVCGGNLRSVEKAVATAGGQAVVVTRDPDVVRKADKVIVPGQGAFGAFTRGLAERSLEEPLREVIARGVPYLGICLGLQVLFDESEEQGPQRGLGLVAGKVVRFRPATHDLKVPHMGWNQVRRVAADPLGDAIADGAHVYFVHSYHVVPADRRVAVMDSDHGGAFCAAIRKDNMFAVQFHPEKSQKVGLALLERFVKS
ncbi:MAG: imidazole glycerol phosphate synthase subunit HisH [Deltaproteobacteria bacterium]|nr:imidazole glycerol phosphate synthase subunit HisH [Kofleriaceae bacterium]